MVRQDEVDRGERDDRPSTDMVEENRRFARENAELRRGNDVLRAASAYFATMRGDEAHDHPRVGPISPREFADFCANNGVTLSMGRRATCFDNAVSESCFATYKLPAPDYMTTSNGP